MSTTARSSAATSASLSRSDNARIARVVPVAEESGDNVTLLLPRAEFVARFTGLDRPDIVAVSNILVETVAFAVLYYRALVIDMAFLKEIADIRGVDVLERHCGHRIIEEAGIPYAVTQGNNDYKVLCMGSGIFEVHINGDKNLFKLLFPSEMSKFHIAGSCRITRKYIEMEKI